jgi:5'-3' exonuclease
VSDRPLLAVDGDSLAHRAYHALPSSIKDAEGAQANMLVGFANMLLSVWEGQRPRAVFVGFDTITVPTYRHELLPGYQAGRDFPPELTSQLDRLPELCSALGFAWAKEAGFEADDFLAAAVDQEESRGGAALVLTSDRDLFQLASRRTTLVMPVKGVSEMNRVGPAEVKDRYGVEPSQVPDLIALRGDNSDRIPGARGIGEKRAATILQTHGTLDAAIEDGLFQEQADALRLYLRIARLQYHAPVPAELPDKEPDFGRGAELAERWGLNRLAERLRGLAAGVA